MQPVELSKSNSLKLLNKIIQLFSLTKNLGREQWELICNDFLRILVSDISELLVEHPLVQIINHNDREATISSSQYETENLSIDLGQGSAYRVNDDLSLFVNRPQADLSLEDRELLDAVIEHLSAAFDWRASIEQGFETQERLKLLHKITVAIRSSLELGEVLATTAEDLGKTLKVDRCFIRRYDPLQLGRVLATEQEYTSSSQVIKAADIIFDFETEWMKNANLTLAPVMNGNSPEYLYLKNVTQVNDDLVQSLAAEIDLVTFMSVPLVNKGAVVGALCFHQCKKEREFTGSELEFIRQVADEATGAIVHAEMYKHIQKEAKTDDLTGLYNKASFHEYLAKEVERSSRSNTDLSVMMIDLDYLKIANDTYGHIVGDEMIKLLGFKLRQILRQVDIIARFGGDEFGVILPDTPLDGAKQLAERVVAQVLATEHPLAGNLSLSLGVAGTPHNILDGPTLIEEADKALYLAKRKGKGRTCFSDNPEIT